MMFKWKIKKQIRKILRAIKNEDIEDENKISKAYKKIKKLVDA